mmetsp:Transcript_24536/g.53614  ORF Transcript_24536/g.53614 Transcript_24536/m.53614 type:complete len:185 (+) Transcript_24536:781-1335(+)
MHFNRYAHRPEYTTQSNHIPYLRMHLLQIFTWLFVTILMLYCRACCMSCGYVDGVQPVLNASPDKPMYDGTQGSQPVAASAATLNFTANIHGPFYIRKLHIIKDASMQMNVHAHAQCQNIAANASDIHTLHSTTNQQQQRCRGNIHQGSARSTILQKLMSEKLFNTNTFSEPSPVPSSSCCFSH